MRLLGLGGFELGICFNSCQLCHLRTLLHLHLLGLGLHLGLLFRRHFLGVRVALAGDSPDPLHQLFAVGDVHPFHDKIQHCHDNLRSHRADLLHDGKKLFGLRLPSGCIPFRL